MAATEINVDELRDALERLAAHASQELLTKQPHWGDAILCDGLLYASHALKSDAPLDAAQRWFEPKLATGPRTKGWFWFWAAEALPALGLYTRTRDPRYLDYACAIIDFLEGSAVRTPDGAFVPHPPAVEVWIDVCYFTAPALALLGRISKNATMLDRAADQMLRHSDHLVDPASGLFWHVAYVDKKTHSQCLWARGNSWFSIAAPQVLAEIEAAGQSDRLAPKVDAIRKSLATQLNMVASLQDRSGLWHTVIDRDDSYLEASSAAGFALALGRAIRSRLPNLEVTRVRESYSRALAAICDKIDVHGAFNGVSQQTPPGDFAFYNSIEVGTAPFATGVCMMALSEALGT